MGELVPIIVLIFIALVIVACFFLRKQLSMSQVVKPLSEAEMIERNKYVITLEEANEMKMGIDEALKSVTVGKNGHYQFDMMINNKSKILTIEVRNTI